MPLTYPYDFSLMTSMQGAELQAQFAAIQTKFNAGIVGGDVAATSGLALSQMPATYEHLSVPLVVHPIAGGWPAAGVMAVHALPEIIGAVAWVAESVTWSCADTGGNAGFFRVQWGEYPTATGLWTVIANVTAVIRIANPAAGGDLGFGGNTNVAVTLTVGATPRVLALVATTADATTLTGGNVWDTLTVTVRLKRQITLT